MTAANISFNTGRSPKAFGMIFVRRRSSRKSRSRRFVRDVSTAAGDRQGFPKHQISAGLRDWERKRRRGSPRARALSVRWGKLAVLAQKGLDRRWRALNAGAGRVPECRVMSNQKTICLGLDVIRDPAFPRGTPGTLCQEVTGQVLGTPLPLHRVLP